MDLYPNCNKSCVYCLIQSIFCIVQYTIESYTEKKTMRYSIPLIQSNVNKTVSFENENEKLYRFLLY